MEPIFNFCYLSNNECTAYKHGICPNLHNQKYSKRLDVQTCTVIIFICNGCQKQILNNSICFEGSNYYKFCFKCCLEYCCGKRTIVFVNDKKFLISTNSINKIRSYMNEYTVKDIEAIIS